MKASGLPPGIGSPSAATRQSLRLRLLFTLAVAVLLIILAEAAAQIALRVRYGRRATEAERLVEYDARLGWANIKNRRALDRYGPGRNATHNSLGLRAIREYDVGVPAGRYRIVFLGDSYTYGVDTGDMSNFVAQIEALAPPIETLNMGVPGYGVDQMYLSYAGERARFSADLLVLAFIEDDLRRMKLGAFMTENPKPRLRLDGQSLAVENLEVPTWGVSTNTSWVQEFPNRLALAQIFRTAYDLFRRDFDTLAVSDRIFSELDRVSREKGQRFAIVYLPTRFDVSGEAPLAARQQIRELAARGQIPFFDVTQQFKAAGDREGAALFGADRQHYSETGYRLVAEILLEEFRAQFPEVPR